MTRSRWWIVLVSALVLVAAIAILLILDTRAVPSPTEPTALPLTRNFDKSPTGFTFYYPDKWQYAIPAVGIMVLGPPDTLNEGALGPTLTVQRAEPLAVVGDLDGALNRYLTRGPLQTEGQWMVTAEARTTRFDERDARVIDLEGSSIAGGAPLHMRILVTSADNTFVYLIIATMPLADRARFEPTIDAILATMHILE